MGAEPLAGYWRAVILALLANGPMTRLELRAVANLSSRRCHYYSRLMKRAGLIACSEGIISLTPSGEARILEEQANDEA